MIAFASLDVKKKIEKDFFCAIISIMKLNVKQKLILLTISVALPLVLMAVYILRAMLSYSDAYDRIVSNMTTANQYNLNFEEELDDSIYRLVVSGTAFDAESPAEASENPYKLIDSLEEDFQKLQEITENGESGQRLRILLRNVSTLRERVDDIADNLREGGHYDDNIEMLNDNIYILSELIQENIQTYLYYQTESIDLLKNTLNHNVLIFSQLMIGGLLLLCVLIIAVVSVLQRSITEPLAALGETTKRIAQGDFSARSEVKSRDELGALSARVNEMAVALEGMVQRIHEDESRMRHAELRLLQEQINPHFLYNTLDTIVWLIEGNQPEEAEEMLLSLSNYFRLVLSRGREFISVEDEEKHIRSYLEIQQVRYRDLLHYEIAISPALYAYEIIKMTLQPIVENALYHGIKNKRSGGMIRITGELAAGQLLLTVSDNGIGMDQETLEKLREEIARACRETESGFGLANVSERIRMNYGSEYGLSVESEPGFGTTVTIRLPAKRKGGTEDEKA